MTLLEIKDTCSIDVNQQYRIQSKRVNNEARVMVVVDNNQPYFFENTDDQDVVTVSSTNLPACNISQTHTPNQSGNLVCRTRKDIKTPPAYGPLTLSFLNYLFFVISSIFLFFFRFNWRVFYVWITFAFLCAHTGILLFLSLILQAEFSRLDKKNVDDEDNYIFDCEQNSFTKAYKSLNAVVVAFTIIGVVLITGLGLGCFIFRKKLYKDHIYYNGQPEFKRLCDEFLEGFKDFRDTKCFYKDNTDNTEKIKEQLLLKTKKTTFIQNYKDKIEKLYSKNDEIQKKQSDKFDKFVQELDDKLRCVDEIRQKGKEKIGRVLQKIKYSKQNNEEEDINED